MAKIGIITTWFGKDVEGGAEKQSYEVAKRLGDSGHDVVVFTTCLKSFHDDWNKDYYRPSDRVESDGIRVIRFATGKRESAPFDHVVEKLLKIPQSALQPGRYAASSLDESIYWRFGINSPDLLRYLRRFKHEYDAFILLPYLFPIVVDAAMILGEKAYLQPCLHDECYAYLRKVEQSMFWAGKLLFNSKGEQELAKRIYGDWVLDKSFIIGEGVEVLENNADIATLRQPKVFHSSKSEFQKHDRLQYFLYLGKKCPEKNTPLAVEAFKQFRKRKPEYKNFRLILAGPSNIDLGGDSEGVEDWGLVDERTKLALLANCRALLIPSMNESFSRVLYEAWFLQSAVVVHQECLATKCAVEEAGDAGFICGDVKEWVDCLEQLAQLSAQSIDMIGKAGSTYASKVASWDQVILRYSGLFQKSAQQQSARSLRGKVHAQLNTHEPQSIQAANLAYALNWSGIPCEWQATDQKDSLSIFYKDHKIEVPTKDLNEVFHSEYFQSGTLDSHLFAEWNDDAFHFLYPSASLSDQNSTFLHQFSRAIKKVTGKPIHWFVYNPDLENKLPGAVSTILHEKVETFLYLADCLVFLELNAQELDFWKSAAELCNAPCILQIPAESQVKVTAFTEKTDFTVYWPDREVDATQSLDCSKFVELLIQQLEKPIAKTKEKDQFLSKYRISEKATALSNEINSMLRFN